MGHQAFYGALATATAALFGVGAGIVWSRIIAMNERAAHLRVEYGDLLNRQVDPTANKLQLAWAQRLRRDELADLHLLAGRVRTATLGPLVVAGLLIVGSAMPLAGILIDDASWYRTLLLVGFLAAVIMWTGALASMSSALLAVTSPAHKERQREREQATAAGHPYLISGDESQLADDAVVEQLAEIFPDLRGLRRRRKGIWRIFRRSTSRRRPIV
jgi:hypothetical protein